MGGWGSVWSAVSRRRSSFTECSVALRCGNAAAENGIVQLRNPWGFVGARHCSVAPGVDLYHVFAKRKVENNPGLLALCNRITALGCRDVTKLVPMMKEWEAKGNELDKDTVMGIMLKLRQWKRPVHAMEIADWMHFRRPFPLDAKDNIMRIDLAARARLPKRALQLFKKLPPREKTVEAYNAVFLLFSTRKRVADADDLYRKLKIVKLQPNQYTFSLLACLYRRCGLHSKVLWLQEEMAAVGVEPDLCILNNVLVAKAEVEGIQSAEELFQQLTTPSSKITHRHVSTFMMMAFRYIAAGMPDKARAMVEEIEKFLDNGTFAKLNKTYQNLITVYGALNDCASIERIWKKSPICKSLDFCNLIFACGRANQVPKAEKYFKQALSKGFVYQQPLYSTMLQVYSLYGMVDKTEGLFQKMKQYNIFRDGRCYHHMIVSHLKAGNIPRALDIVELGHIAGVRHGCAKLRRETLVEIMKALEQTGDLIQAENVLNDWRKSKLKADTEAYNLLLRIYLKAGKQPAGNFIKRLAGNNQQPNRETHELLAQIASAGGEVVSGDYYL